jgi:hypothetical protein
VLMDDNWGQDPIDLCEGVAKSAVRLAIVLALLIGSALLSLGVLIGMWL